MHPNLAGPPQWAAAAGSVVVGVGGCHRPPCPAARDLAPAFTLSAHSDAATTLGKPPEEHPLAAPASQASQLACKVSPSCIVTYMLRDRSPAR